ncbi:HTH domain-containing protein [Myxococcota bacterium]|nr:HTH domain-containing protein [Myxococcota bacterium]
MTEDDVFRFVLPIKEVAGETSEEIEQMAGEMAEMAGEKAEVAGEIPDLVIKILATDPTLTVSELAIEIDKSVRTIERSLQKLQTEGRLCRIGSTKSGHWEVLK